jgi:hypothetical protein
MAACSKRPKAIAGCARNLRFDRLGQFEVNIGG